MRNKGQTINNKLPIKYRKSIARVIRELWKNLLKRKDKKDQIEQNKKTNVNNNDEKKFKTKLYEEYQREDNKRKILEMVNQHPELILQMSESRLKELNQLLEEQIAINNTKMKEFGTQEDNANSITEIKKHMKEQYNLTFLLMFDYNGKTYAQGFRNDNWNTVYFNVKNNDINPIADSKLLSAFQDLYEIKPSYIVYSNRNNIYENIYKTYTDTDVRSGGKKTEPATRQYLEFVRSYASQKLESCQLFTSVYGYNFATYRLNSLEKVILQYGKIHGACYNMIGNGSIELYYKNEKCQDPISDCEMLATILHESIHHVLRRLATQGTGMMFVINGKEIGRGLNEGLTE